jgi:hypothetical protein
MIFWLGAAVWVACVAAGLKVVYDYQSAPGKAADAPATWPAATRVPRAQGAWQLVMLAHPRCPCTRASIGELAIVMARAAGTLKAHVLFVKPDGVDATWEHTDLWDSADRIPGVTALVDPGGREAAALGAKTSGQVVLYDPAGRLRFAGGITPTRSHSGDNVGRQRILELVARGTADRNLSAVFGCPLFDEKP